MKLREYLIEKLKVDFASGKGISAAENILKKAKIKYKTNGSEITMAIDKDSLMGAAILDKLKEVGHFTEKK